MNGMFIQIMKFRIKINLDKLKRNMDTEHYNFVMYISLIVVKLLCIVCNPIKVIQLKYLERIL